MQKMNRNRYLKTKNSITGEIPQDLGLNVIKNNINYIVKAIVKIIFLGKESCCNGQLRMGNGE